MNPINLEAFKNLGAHVQGIIISHDMDEHFDVITPALNQSGAVRLGSQPQ